MSGAAGTERPPRAGSLRVAGCGMLAAACTFLISGCGQKGPLYLPQRTGTVVTRPAQGAQSAQSAQGEQGERSSESSSSSSSSTSSASSSARLSRAK